MFMSKFTCINLLTQSGFLKIHFLQRLPIDSSWLTCVNLVSLQRACHNRWFIKRFKDKYSCSMPFITLLSTLILNLMNKMMRNGKFVLKRIIANYPIYVLSTCHSNLESVSWIWNGLVWTFYGYHPRTMYKYLVSSNCLISLTMLTNKALFRRQSSYVKRFFR